jgi:hypothetical protein
VQAAHFHFSRRDTPLSMLKIKFSPFSLTKLARSDKDQWRKLQSCFCQRHSVVIIDGSEQCANAHWINNGGPVDDFWRSLRTPQVDGRIALGPAGSNGIAKHYAAGAAQPPRSLVSPARLNFAENRKQLWRGDFGYGPRADCRIHNQRFLSRITSAPPSHSSCADAAHIP